MNSAEEFRNAVFLAAAKPTVVLPDVFQAISELPLTGCHKLGSVVSASIVDENDLPTGECLAENAVEAFVQVASGIIGRNDDTYTWHQSLKGLTKTAPTEPGSGGCSLDLHDFRGRESLSESDVVCREAAERSGLILGHEHSHVVK